MQPMRLLHKTFANQLPTVHKIRLNSLMDASHTLVMCPKLSLTALGRNMLGKAKTRSQIKKVDRLLGNRHLHADVPKFYKTITHLVSQGLTPWIHIDWSCISSVTNLYVLRASLSMPGRSIAIYEEAHYKKQENNHETHKLFLNKLKAILPKAVKPVIITDAGFRGPWFSYVRSLGWDFVGRLRNENLIYLEPTQKWQLSKEFYEEASAHPKYLGKGILTKKQKVECHFVLYKGKKKNRHKLNRNKSLSRASKSKRYSKTHKEPWLLVTSLEESSRYKQIVKIYSKRMQIEENFRDTKCMRFGFGLNISGTKTPQRMSILLLIAAIATLICWIAGTLVRKNGNASDFQAHSAKFTSILSVVYLGREALRKQYKMTQECSLKALSSISYEAISQQEIAAF